MGIGVANQETAYLDLCCPRRVTCQKIDFFTVVGICSGMVRMAKKRLKTPEKTGFNGYTML